MSHTKHWITKIVPVLAFAAGIIITSIGGIMTTSSSLKLALFDSGPYSYIDRDSCRNNYEKPTVNSSDNFNSRAEMELCINDLKQQELQRFQKSQKENIVDGVSALIVGGILLLAFRKRK